MAVGDDEGSRLTEGRFQAKRRVRAGRVWPCGQECSQATQGGKGSGQSQKKDDESVFHIGPPNRAQGFYLGRFIDNNRCTVAVSIRVAVAGGLVGESAVD